MGTNCYSACCKTCSFPSERGGHRIAGVFQESFRPLIHHEVCKHDHESNMDDSVSAVRFLVFVVF